MHLREMMISEDTDPKGPIFRAYAFRKEAVSARRPRNEHDSARDLIPWAEGGPSFTPRLEVSEQQRAAIIQIASQSRPRIRKRSDRPRTLKELTRRARER